MSAEQHTLPKSQRERSEDWSDKADQDRKMASMLQRMSRRDARIAELAEQLEAALQERDVLADELTQRFKELAALTRRMEETSPEIREEGVEFPAALGEHSRIDPPTVERNQDEIARLKYERRHLIAKNNQLAAREMYLENLTAVLKSRGELQAARITNMIKHDDQEAERVRAQTAAQRNLEES